MHEMTVVQAPMLTGDGDHEGNGNEIVPFSGWALVTATIGRTARTS